MAVTAKFTVDDAREMREQFEDQKIQRQVDDIMDRFKGAIADGATSIYVEYQDNNFQVVHAIESAGFTVTHDDNGGFDISF